MVTAEVSKFTVRVIILGFLVLTWFCFVDVLGLTEVEFTALTMLCIVLVAGRGLVTDQCFGQGQASLSL